MYKFLTKKGLVFKTEYSPKEISKFYHFDAFDSKANRFVILTKDVDFKTFEYID
ncbi:hypothetical protein GCM10011514_07330 [Emticicia aquatilis]|uniref:Uncharacterized protein n=1 Tax=Emticicia aquatilis TaxID=1537369 RepID=A0A916YI92_9BACT|nr:hypothetical protein GCM10011514_07330 [Emticicia aquatilis]